MSGLRHYGDGPGLAALHAALAEMLRYYADDSALLVCGSPSALSTLLGSKSYGVPERIFGLPVRVDPSALPESVYIVDRRYCSVPE